MEKLVEYIHSQLGKLPACSNCTTPIHLMKSVHECTGTCTYTLYCNESCQREHWVQHKLECIGVRTDTAKKRTRDEEEDQEEEEEGSKRSRTDDVISYKDLKGDMWSLIVGFLNLEDLKSFSLADKTMAAVARQRTYSQYWIRLPETADAARGFLSENDRFKYIRKVTGVTEPVYDVLQEFFYQPEKEEWMPLEAIEFGNHFNQPVDNLPQSLQTLTFDYWFNQRVDNLPQSLQTLTFGSGFNQRVDNLPRSLKTLTFGSWFNQPVDNLPQSLQTLTFGSWFNQPVDNLPQSLQTLTFGRNFNQPVDNLPQSLQTLTFGYWFNQPVDNLPQSLQTLTFGRNFNQPVDNLPQSLQKLILFSNEQMSLFNPQILEKLEIHIKK